MLRIAVVAVLVSCASPKTSSTSLGQPVLAGQSTTDKIPEFSLANWSHWIDADNDCQNTRQEVLIRDSEIAVTFQSPSGCVVASGRWVSANGEVTTNPADLDVVHSVPLQVAHALGGYAWAAQKRENYANMLEDDSHLVTVKRSADPTEQKDILTNTPQSCEHWNRWLAVHIQWELRLDGKIRLLHQSECLDPVQFCGKEVERGATKLSCNNKSLTDIAALAKLTSLKQLDLASTQIKDLGPLRHLRHLEELNLYETPVVDLTPLAQLPALRSLNLCETQVVTLRPLATLTTIEELLICDTQISDLGPLKSLTNLRALSIRRTPTQNIIPLAHLFNLEHFSATETKIETLDALANLVMLKYLDVESTPVRDLSPLSELSQLEQLFLNDTQVSDLRPLGKLGSLVQLSLRNSLVPLTSPAGIQALLTILPNLKIYQ